MACNMRMATPLRQGATAARLGRRSSTAALVAARGFSASKRAALKTMAKVQYDYDTKASAQRLCNWGGGQPGDSGVASWAGQAPGQGASTITAPKAAVQHRVGPRTRSRCAGWPFACASYGLRGMQGDGDKPVAAAAELPTCPPRRQVEAGGGVAAPRCMSGADGASVQIACMSAV